MTWSVPFFRLFGIQVRVHLLYILIMFGIVFRSLMTNPAMWVDVLIFTVVMGFAAVLLHEFGHCFAARWVHGEANEVLIWPLGGLAFCDVPHTPRANFITTIWGPGTNLMLFGICGIVLAAASYLPPLNPLQNPYRLELTNWREGRTAIATNDVRYIRKGSTIEVVKPEQILNVEGELYGLSKDKTVRLERATHLGTVPTWVMWVARFAWLNWLLFLLNLIPCFPLDGGRLLQAIVWKRTDARQGMLVATYSSYVVAILLVVLAFAINEVLLLAMAIFVFSLARQQQLSLETQLLDMQFGYDFSQGYTSLERGLDEGEPAKKPRRPNFIKRWLQERAARRLRKEAEQRSADEARMDALLEKISREGKESLTPEERRFLDRVSARYRNRMN
ncbi:peptidase m50 : Peptidase M50 OS=Planctomyces brasiliensis (strain ATCC 49424 / DSM 5305 / JCM 21570 / NBRC 103401 / IFAM 1448) GN=Plabr_2002 PE=4 SV=1: Peptidase_M50 [Tuwongella immobilis]|uniref:Uncharacterized protein n=2 Tax=Tuwongella immobilis TaxID=692036 RepID=A0A6C2YTS9_9BACT|nr:peptidase m50 : Peptidase M50 OS=Planctomyces brasiliensis (strain ATCC 49424 / DSM 5305 / JCM 21570 / NBRC 103401 / IFAM 1448) GN=Plabr_2002 PE=4 SV=1: Peptidase_M50 [Tuwongella immobilis]VTS06427.1 peptidase m50 : Peptidase M50 OS=Planctomyces brasiliensis (strain ATCC 49424 / DSM 5305 / JCM 21570 / NBRC 103401 / IFAM 1448) GN=Plabr_2002 PE=4 SV=1: Peptidase_M50 [Tuwongella immobilis]